MGDTILYLLRLLDHEENSVVEMALETIAVIITGGVACIERLLTLGVAPLLAKLLLSHKDQMVIKWTCMCVADIVVVGHNIESLVTDEIVNRLVEICADAEDLNGNCYYVSSIAICKIVPFFCETFFYLIIYLTKFVFTLIFSFIHEASIDVEKAQMFIDCLINNPHLALMAVQVLAAIARSTNMDDLAKQVLLNNAVVSRLVSLLDLSNYGPTSTAAVDCLRSFVDSSSAQLKNAVVNSVVVPHLTAIFIELLQPPMVQLDDEEEYRSEVIIFLLAILRDDDFQKFHHDVAMAIANYMTIGNKSHTFLIDI